VLWDDPDRDTALTRLQKMLDLRPEDIGAAEPCL